MLTQITFENIKQIKIIKSFLIVVSSWNRDIMLRLVRPLSHYWTSPLIKCLDQFQKISLLSLCILIFIKSSILKCKPASLYLTLRCLLTEMLFWTFSDIFSSLRHLEDNYEYFRADHAMNYCSLLVHLNVDFLIKWSLLFVDQLIKICLLSLSILIFIILGK